MQTYSIVVQFLAHSFVNFTLLTDSFIVSFSKLLKLWSWMKKRRTQNGFPGLKCYRDYPETGPCRTWHEHQRFRKGSSMDYFSCIMWRHKHEISEIMGFARIFWKNNVQEADLPKMSISGQIVSEIVVHQLCLENCIQTLLNCFGSTPPKIRRVWIEFSEYKRLTSQRQFAPKYSFLASRPLGHCSFRRSWQIP